MTLERAVDILNVNVICSPKATEFKEAVDVVKLALRQSVEFIPNSKDIEDIQRDAVINFANELMCNLDGDIETYANAGHSLNVYAWLKSYLESKGAIKAEPELFGNPELMKGE